MDQPLRNALDRVMDGWTVSYIELTFLAPMSLQRAPGTSTLDAVGKKHQVLVALLHIDQTVGGGIERQPVQTWELA